MSFAGYLIRVRLSPQNLVTRFIWLAMNCDYVRNQIEKPIRSTVGLKNVNSTELAALSIPLPPLAEQYRIVTMVDELMALCDRLEASVHRQIFEGEHLGINKIPYRLRCLVGRA